MAAIVLGNAKEDFLTAGMMHGEDLTLILPKALPDNVIFPNIFYAPIDDQSRFASLGLSPLAKHKRAVQIQDNVYELPLKPWLVHRLFDRSIRKKAAKNWLSARAMALSASLTGIGMEERSYRDWVERRMGPSVYSALYAQYALMRWGADGTELSASLARWHHHLSPVGEQWGHSNGSVGLINDAERLFKEQGKLIESTITSLNLENGKVSSIGTTNGILDVDGPLFSALAPIDVCRLLGEALPISIRVDSGHLQMNDMVQAVVEGSFQEFPDQIHFIDSSPCYRAFFDSGRGVFEFRAGTEDEAILSFFQDNSTVFQINVDDLLIKRSQQSQPRWLRQSHIRLRRVLGYFLSIGIVPVGRMGLFAHQDPLTAAIHASEISKSHDLSYIRNYIEPPVFIRDLDARITRFLTR